MAQRFRPDPLHEPDNESQRDHPARASDCGPAMIRPGPRTAPGERAGLHAAHPGTRCGRSRVRCDVLGAESCALAGHHGDPGSSRLTTWRWRQPSSILSRSERQPGCGPTAAAGTSTRPACRWRCSVRRRRGPMTHRSTPTRSYRPRSRPRTVGGWRWTPGVEPAPADVGRPLPVGAASGAVAAVRGGVGSDRERPGRASRGACPPS